MTPRSRLAAMALFTALLVGCGSQIKPMSVEPVDVSGSVTGPDGKPLKDLLLNFQPTGGNAQQTFFTLKADGSFSGKMNVGKYTYFLSGDEKKHGAALKALPAGWKEGSLERQVEVTGGKIGLKF